MTEIDETAPIPSVQEDKPAGHTKGEWIAEMARWTPDTPAFGYTVRVEGRAHPVASDCVYLHTSNGEYTPAELEANARLIAAAPDLLEALQAVLTHSGARGSYHALKYGDAVEQAEAAISKALPMVSE